MEVVPQITSPEAAEQQDLLEAFAEREVTLFGITGTFKDLAAMCPVDLSNPRITVEAKNEFVVKAANEACLAIKPEHEAMFARITEQHGLERKFTIAAPVKTPDTEVNPEPTPRKAIETATGDSSEKQATTPIDATTAEPSKRVEQLRQEWPIPEATTVAITEQPAVDPPLMRAREALQTVKFKASRQEISYTDTHPALLKEVTEKVRPQPIIAGIPTILQEEEASAPADDVAHDETPITLQLEHDVAISSTSLPETMTAEVIDQATELLKEPAEIYEHFTEALRLFAESPILLALTGESGNSSTMTSSDIHEQGEPIPAILTTVIEQLAELEPEEKEQVALIIQDIAGMLYDMRPLEVEGVGSEPLAAMEDELAELCTMLFEAIGIDYEDQDIKRFIRVLRHQKFHSPRAIEQGQLDLEHLGTHEVKHTSQFVNSLADAGQRLNHLLGMFVLSCAAGTLNF